MSKAPKQTQKASKPSDAAPPDQGDVLEMEAPPAPPPEAPAPAPALKISINPERPEGAKSSAVRKLATALRKPVAPPPKAPPKDEAPRTPIEDAIELALASASTAVDSAHEIQRLRGEVNHFITGARRNNQILFYATLLILLIAGTGIFGALVYYKRAYNEYEAVAKVNREALVAFAGEINSLVAASQKIDENVKGSSTSLAETNALTEEVKKSLQTLVVADTALAAKMPTLAANEKTLAGIKQSLDDLAASNKALQARMSESVVARPAAAPAPPQASPVRAAPKPARKKPAPKPATPPRPLNRTPAGESMIRYP